MSNLFPLSAAAFAGALLGGFFFGGLWWTVRKGLHSNHPALWFFGSTLLRTGLVLTGFFFTSAGDWRKLLACLLGFFVARIVVTRLTRINPEGYHASK